MPSFDTETLAAVRKSMVQVNSDLNLGDSSVRTACDLARVTASGYSDVNSALTRLREAWNMEIGEHRTIALDMAHQVDVFRVAVDELEINGGNMFDSIWQ